MLTEEARGAISPGRRSLSRRLLHHLRAFALFLVYCLRWDFRPTESSNKVAYLDGLRGVAALCVFSDHSHGIAYPDAVGTIPSTPYGYRGQYYFTSAPLVRLFFTGGPFSVCCFFVISGYVISLSPLRKLHNNQHARLAVDLGVAFPKRFVRLYIPVIGTTFVYMTCWYLFGGPQKRTWPHETVAWFYNFIAQSWYYMPAGFYGDHYNGHLWSIATEVHGSYTVYIALLCGLGFCRRGTTFRICGYLGVIFYLLFLVDGYELRPRYQLDPLLMQASAFMALFLFGMLMCDLRLLSDSNELPKWALELQRTMQRGKGFFFWLIAALAIFLSSSPGGLEEQYLTYGPLYISMLRLTPRGASAIWEFWMSLGAICVMLTLSHFSFLRRILETRFCQWLGKISLGLYLIHGPLLYGLGGRIYRFFGLINDDIEGYSMVLALPEYGPVGFDLRYIGAQCIIAPLAFYMAIVTTKFFDEPSVRIARYLCSPEPHSAPLPKHESIR